MRITSNQLICRDAILSSEVREVRLKVMNKPIDRDIYDNILTSITSKINNNITRARTRAHGNAFIFWGNEVIFKQNQAGHIFILITLWLTSLPLRAKSYLRRGLPLVISPWSFSYLRGWLS